VRNASTFWKLVYSNIMWSHIKAVILIYPHILRIRLKLTPYSANNTEPDYCDGWNAANMSDPIGCWSDRIRESWRPEWSYGADKAVVLNIVHSELYRIIILPTYQYTGYRYHCSRTYDPDRSVCASLELRTNLRTNSHSQSSQKTNRIRISFVGLRI
jgi:hypothetical protein